MSDLAMLRGLKTLFASVASTTTLWRTINQVGPAELRDLAQLTSRPGSGRGAWSRHGPGS
jgi:hypothetical protein